MARRGAAVGGDVLLGRSLVDLVAVVIAAVLFKAILDWVYVGYVARHFATFSLQCGSFGRVVVSYIAVATLAGCLGLSLSMKPRASGVALILQFVTVIAPLFSLYSHAGAPAAFVYAAAGGFALLLAATDLMPRLRVARPSRGVRAAGLCLLVAISVYVYSGLLRFGGLSRFSLDLLSVYDVRGEFLAGSFPLMNYLVPWQASVFNMALLAVGLHRRRYWVIALSCVAQLAVFGMTGQKSFLLAPLLVLGVFIVWRRRSALAYLFCAVAALVVVAYVVFLVSGDQLAPSILVRRMFFVPASNHLIYYDFFSNPEHPFVMLSNSIFAPFVNYPYDQPLTRVISWAYWGRDFSPNVGYLGDAYAQFGFLGMFLFSGALGVFLRLLDSVAAKIPSHLAAAIMAVPAMALTNSALLTSLLTHGLIPTLVLIWFLQGVSQVQTGRTMDSKPETHLVPPGENTNQV